MSDEFEAMKQRAQALLDTSFPEDWTYDEIRKDLAHLVALFTAGEIIAALIREKSKS